MKGTKNNKIKKHSKSQKAGLLFPVSRIGRFLRQGHFAPNISYNAAISMTAVIEYLVREMLEITIKLT